MSLEAFKAALAMGGARPNQFRVQLAFPSAVPATMAGLAAPFLIKASSLPPVTIGTATVMYQGRPIPLAGERQFQPWSVTCYNDNNFLLRNSLEAWSNLMNNFQDNTGVITPLSYKAEATVHQLDRNKNIVKSYRFVGLYPDFIGEIGLDFGDNDRVEEFTCSFQYENYETEF